MSGDTIRDVMEPFVNDPSTYQLHDSKIVQKWIKDDNVEVPEWPAQNLDLNPDYAIFLATTVHTH